MQRFRIVRPAREIEFPVLLASFRKIKDIAVFATTLVAHEGESSGWGIKRC